MTNKIKLFFFGILIGVSDLIPGVSGGTMAFILGVYEKLVSTIGFFLKDLRNWKNNLLFLVPIFSGILIGILLFSKLFKYLLTYYSVYTFVFFSGLIIASLPFFTKKLFKLEKNKVSLKSFIIYFLLGIALPVMMIFIEKYSSIPHYHSSDFVLPSLKWLLLVFVGLCAALAMLLPGFSGSLLLIITGFYKPILNMIDIQSLTHYIIPLLFFTSGIGLGLLIGSFIISLLLKKFPKETLTFILGIIIGSLLYILDLNILPFLGQTNLWKCTFIFLIAISITTFMETKFISVSKKD